MKRLIKQFLAVCIYYSGLLWLYRRLFPRKYPAILMYHRVLTADDPTYSATQPGMTVTQGTFDRQLALLKSRYPILRIDDFAQRVRKREKIPANAVIITFDDGWGDNYTYAWPVLKKNEVPATIFLTTNNIGDRGMFWFVRVGILLRRNDLTKEELLHLYLLVRTSRGLPEDHDAHKFTYSDDPLWFIELCKRLDSDGIEELIDTIVARTGDTPDKWPKQKYMLYWPEIREMAGPLVAFGSHGCAHTIFTTLSPEDLALQLRESRKIIEREIGLPVVTCAYPNGNHNETIRRAARDTGYLCAAAVRDPYGRSHPDDMYALQRQNIFEGKSSGVTGRFSRALFLCQLEGVL